MTTTGHTNRRAHALARQLRDLRNVARALPDALLLLDRRQHLQWANPAARRLLGVVWPRDRAVSMGKRFHAHPVGLWLRGAGTGEVPSPVNAARLLQLTRADYDAERHVVLARDITRVQKLEQMRRDFVANVSHELRTPLTVIHGYLEMLEPDDVPALSSVLEDLRTQSQRMRQIVDDLLVLSRLETGQALPRERVPMAPLLEALRQEAEALSQGRHEILLEDAARQDLLGSRADLHSAFSNLVSNAVRYTPDGGRITIRWALETGAGVYSVTDTGVGIPAEHLPRLTERFYRVSSSRSRAKGGTGLGLSIVKHVLDLHNARLRMASQLGVGSTFACVFDSDCLLAPGA